MPSLRMGKVLDLLLFAYPLIYDNNLANTRS